MPIDDTENDVDHINNIGSTWKCILHHNWYNTHYVMTLDEYTILCDDGTISKSNFKLFHGKTIMNWIKTS